MKSPLLKTRWSLTLAVIALCAIIAGGCIHFNSDPVICSLKAKQERVALSGNTEIDCIASDTDGDNLTYTWSATGGTFSGQGPTVNWMAPSIPGPYLITANVTDGRGGAATAQLTLDAVEVNHPPVIESLSAEPPEVKMTDASTIKCVASDPDGDALNYLWLTTGGTFSSQGPTVNWTSPSNPGSYLISVKVTDGGDGEATSQLTVVVLVNHPPVIESLTAEPSPVKQGKIATITCVASDPDGDALSYTWAADRGGISGQGPTIDWTAPNSCGNCIIKLTVADGRGGQVSKELEIAVQAG